MDVLSPVCAGIDVHRDSLTVCVLSSPPGRARPTPQTRTFSTFPDDLRLLSAWLAEQQVPLAVMEGTGVYWMPVHAALEAQCQVLVANAHHVKNVPGRKTDVADSRWLAQLARHGLLSPSFVPPKDIRVLRSLSREHHELTRERATLINRLHRLLDQHGHKLGSVVSDLQGTTARAMLRLLAKGQTDVETLVACARTSLKRRAPDLRRALEAPLPLEAREQLDRKLRRWDLLEQQLAEVEARLEEHRAPLRPTFERLTKIPGIGTTIATTIVAEIGVDMGTFPTAAHLASWAGVCPGNNESAGKKRSGRTRKGNTYLKTALIEAALGAARSKGTHLKARYYALRSRRGPKKAAMAIGHQLLRIVWALLSEPTARYHERGEGALDAQRKKQSEKKLIARLEALGHEVTLRPRPTPPTPPTTPPPALA